MPEQPTLRDELAQRLHHSLCAAQNLPWEEGDTCDDCKVEADAILQLVEGRKPEEKERSVCLRRDHTHRPEFGCWEYKPLSERCKEADSAVVEQRKEAAIRLDEAKWWCHTPELYPGCECIGCKRVAELEKLAAQPASGKPK